MVKCNMIKLRQQGRGMSSKIMLLNLVQKVFTLPKSYWSLNLDVYCSL